MNFKLVSLNIGKVKDLQAGKRVVKSGYSKFSVETAHLTKTGFDGDEQADLKHHGGEDKAVCVYSIHNLKSFEDYLGHVISLPGFGENFSVDMADENELFIGDVFTNGSVKLQISQPRQPCFKTGAYHGNNGVIKLMSENGRTGFYFRVLEEGDVCKGEEFSRLSSDQIFSLKASNDIMYRRNKNEEDLRRLINCEALSSAWKDELGARLSD